jgi:hypothetical protein
VNHRPYALVTYGEHKGRAGYVVSTPWIGNLWHLRVTLNVNGRRWITVWRWEIEPADPPR